MMDSRHFNIKNVANKLVVEFCNELASPKLEGILSKFINEHGLKK